MYCHCLHEAGPLRNVALFTTAVSLTGCQSRCLMHPHSQGVYCHSLHVACPLQNVALFTARINWLCPPASHSLIAKVCIVSLFTAPLNRLRPPTPPHAPLIAKTCAFITKKNACIVWRLRLSWKQHRLLNRHATVFLSSICNLGNCEGACNILLVTNKSVWQRSLTKSDAWDKKSHI